MNGLISRMAKKKKKKLFGENELKDYPYFQISKFINAYLSKDQSLIAKAAQAVYYWPSFSELFEEKSSQDDYNDDVPSVSIINFRRKSKKKKKIRSQKNRSKKVKGEYVSDEPQKETQPIDVVAASVKIKKEEISTVNKVNKKENIEIRKFRNWTDWNTKKMNKITLADYTKWLNNFNKKEQEPAEKVIKKKSKKKSTSKGIKARLHASVDLNEEIVSEPLADLLAEQEHFDDAIKMYEKLSLIFPEKSSFFADKIKDLKSKKS